MIRPEELRIGNHYQHIQAGIIQLDKEWISYFAKYPELLSGVPITEDWFIKFGFKSIGNLHPTFRKGCYLVEESLMRDGKYFVRQIMNAEDSLVISKPIEHVHTFQNFFYAHGEDLKEEQK
jgi:hypothetical protein